MTEGSHTQTPSASTLMERSTARTRVLHVLVANEVGPCTLRALAREAVRGDAVLVFGPSSAVASLRRYGLAREISCENMASVGGSWWLAITLAAARLAARWRSSERVVAHGVFAQRIAHGAGCESCELVRPRELESVTPATFTRTNSTRPTDDERARVRRELGMHSDEYAVLIAGEPVARLDTRFLARAAAMAYVGGARMRLIASPAIPDIMEVSRRFQRTTEGALIVLDARAEEPWRLMDAVDAVLIDCDGGLHSPQQCAGGLHAHALDARLGLASLTPTLSSRPALEALNAERVVIAHESLDLGVHASSTLVHRFDSDIAVLARVLMECAGARHLHAVRARV